MPIYEYECEDCGKAFELLVRSDTKIACPECGSTKANKRFSTFAAQSGGGPEIPPCAGNCCGGLEQGRCGSGMCGI